MSKLKFIIAAAVCVASITVADAPAVAATATANLAVSANVPVNCTIAAGTLSFGAYDPLTANAATNLDMTGSFTVSCTNGTPYTISLDAGANGGKSAAATRAMASGTNYLGYEIYSDSGRTTIWTSGSSVTSTSKAPATLTVYGRIPAGQDAAVGSYSDTVVETVTF